MSGPLEPVLARVARRVRLVRAFHGGMAGATLGLGARVLAAVTAAAPGFEAAWFPWTLGLGCLGAIAATLLPVDRRACAGALDRTVAPATRNHDRVAAAEALAKTGTGPFVAAAVADAAASVRDLDVARVVPFGGWSTLGVVTALTVGAVLAPRAPQGKVRSVHPAASVGEGSPEGLVADLATGRGSAEPAASNPRGPIERASATGALRGASPGEASSGEASSPAGTMSGEALAALLARAQASPGEVGALERAAVAARSAAAEAAQVGAGARIAANALGAATPERQGATAANAAESAERLANAAAGARVEAARASEPARRRLERLSRDLDDASRRCAEAPERCAEELESARRQAEALSREGGQAESRARAAETLERRADEARAAAPGRAPSAQARADSAEAFERRARGQPEGAVDQGARTGSTETEGARGGAHASDDGARGSGDPGDEGASTASSRTVGGNGIGDGKSADPFGRKTRTPRGANGFPAALRDAASGPGPSRAETIEASAARGFDSAGYARAYATYATIDEAPLPREALPEHRRALVRRYFELIRPRSTDVRPFPSSKVQP